MTLEQLEEIRKELESRTGKIVQEIADRHGLKGSTTDATVTVQKDLVQIGQMVWLETEREGD